jgi:hypothetical protein
LAEPLVAAEDASLPVVDQNGVADGIEGVFPLLVGGGDLFNQMNVLKRQP